MANVDWVKPEVSAALADWKAVRAVCAGQTAMKALGKEVLPMPNPTDASSENAERYKQYLKRAVFFNATGRTLNSLTGAAYRLDPEIDVSGIDYIAEDADGKSVSLYQQSQRVLQDVLMVGRAGLLADYPTTEAPVSKADQIAGQIRATISVYQAESVINWRYVRTGSQYKLSMVVLAETTCMYVGFEEKTIEQRRVLKLEGAYIVEIWRKDDKKEWALFSSAMPTDGRGNFWKEIPFCFVGAVNNDADIDRAPLADIAMLNIAHFCNSADYEDSVFFVGQAQPVITGLNQQWADMLKKDGVCIGSRTPIPLPENSDFKFVQAEPNTLVKEAMDQKEAQMIALSARLIEKGSAVKTATQVRADSEAEHSVLSLVVENISNAYEKALQWVALFMNATANPVFCINDDFGVDDLTAQDRQQLMAEWQSGLIGKSDARSVLRKAGVIDEGRTDEDIDAENELDDAGLGLDIAPVVVKKPVPVDA